MEDVPIFETEKITLSGRDKAGRNLTANVYTLEGVTNADGSPRLMSIAQLCMAICLQRASNLEAKLIEVMNVLATHSDDLEFLANIEDKAIGGETRPYSTDEWNRMKALIPDLRGATDSGITDLTLFCSDLESAMDSLNSLSQELLIEIETLTAKRDDTYTLVSNVTKSCYQTLSGIVANV